MSRFLTVFMLLAIIAACSMVLASDGRKTSEVYRTCGKALFRRVHAVCGEPCFGPAAESIAELTCSVGASDDQISALCCPQ